MAVKPYNVNADEHKIGEHEAWISTLITEKLDSCMKSQTTLDYGPSEILSGDDTDDLGREILEHVLAHFRPDLMEVSDGTDLPHLR